MQDATQLAVKAAIIENAAVKALQWAMRDNRPPGMMAKTALHHMADAHIWAVSVLTAEPVATVRARVNAAAKDRKPLGDYSPRRVTA